MIMIQKCIFGLAITFALAGCSSFDDETFVERIIIDPTHFELYTCADLDTALIGLKKREIELQNIMEKASRGTGGAFVNMIANEDEYRQIRGNEKLALKQQREKNCLANSKNKQEQ